MEIDLAPVETESGIMIAAAVRDVTARQALEEQLAQATNTPFLGKIPIEQAVREGGDSGQPIVVMEPNSASALALRGIAESLAAKISVAALSGKHEMPINIVD